MKYSSNKVILYIVAFFYLIGMIGILTSGFWNEDISSFIINHFFGIGLSFLILLFGGFLKIIDLEDFEDKLNFGDFSGNLILLILQIVFSLLYTRGSEGLKEIVWFVISPTLLIILREYFGTLYEIKKMLKNKE